MINFDRQTEEWGGQNLREKKERRERKKKK